ncbi:MAG: YggT family protein [Gammaproteobacteria bacterium]|nr:YggT family protein [Gammaproteobacteria bacterium]
MLLIQVISRSAYGQVNVAVRAGAHAGGLVGLVLDVYFWALIILVILSWVAPGNAHPAALLLHQITEPLVAPFRRLIPPIGRARLLDHGRVPRS